MSSPFRRKNTGGVIGGASTQQMVDDLEQAAREDQQRFFLGTASIQQALVTVAPFRPVVRRHQSRQVEGMAQGARSPLGEALLPCQASAVMSAWFQAGIGDHLIDRTE